MSDDLAIIIIVAITAAIIFLYYIISKTIARFIFKHLSPTTKNRITKYYRVNFFSTLINGAIAGLCVWPFYYLYLIPHFDYVLISDWFENGFEIYYLLEFFLIPFVLPLIFIFCAMFGIVFWFFSDIAMYAGKMISKSNADLSINIETNSTNQFSYSFVLILFGALIISQSFPDTNLLTALVLSACMELGKRICKWILSYLECKTKKVFWKKKQRYSSIIIFFISILCVFCSCIYGKSIDFAGFGSKIQIFGPLLLFFSFYDELLKCSFMRQVFEVGLEIVDEALDIYGYSLDLKELAPIYIFSSVLSFVLTFVLTRDIWFSLVAIVIVIISLKKPKLKWMYAVFGVVVSFNLSIVMSSFFNKNLLVLAVSVLYAISFLVMEFLQMIAWEDIDMKNLNDLLE